MPASLLALPNELLLIILDAVHCVDLSAFVVALGSHLVARALVAPVPPPELRAMRAFALRGRVPPRRRSEGWSSAPEWFYALPAELWILVGSGLGFEDRAAFAIAVWRELAPRWAWDDAQRREGGGRLGRRGRTG
jgi:hypothetical protein